MTSRDEFLLKWRGEPEALLELLSSMISDEGLERIASLDYGRDVEVNLEALRQIRNKPWHSDRRLEWHPKEVLELTQWDEPDFYKSEQNVRDGHLYRAFACAVLLRAGADPVNSDSICDDNSTVVQLLASVLKLGGELPEAVFRFLVFRMHHGVFPCEEQRPFFLFALVLLGTLQERIGDVEMIIMLDWLEADERAIREGEHFLDTNSRWKKWLLGLTNFDARHSGWMDLAETILLEREHTKFPVTGLRLVEIGERVARYYEKE